MAIFKVTPANSVTTTGISQDAFNDDTALADTLIVDGGASLKAEGASAFGAFLGNTGAWTVQVNGQIRSERSIAVCFDGFNPAKSVVAVGSAGDIWGGETGIYSIGAFDVVNAGSIFGTGKAIESGGMGAVSVQNTGNIVGVGYAIFSGPYADAVTNSGIIEGAIYLEDGNDRLINNKNILGLVSMGDGDDTVTNARGAMITAGLRLGIGHDTLTNAGRIGGNIYCGEGNDIVTNSGTFGGSLALGGGRNTVTNTGSIIGDVIGGDDSDAVKSSGLIEGLIDLRGGDDIFTGGNYAEIVVDGAGSDIVKLGGGDDVYFGIGNFNQAADGFDVIDGGAGFDTYNATSAADSVFINLDKIAHDFSPFLPGVGIVAGSTATGIGLSVDTIRNFEAVIGGAGNDVIYGNAAANLLIGGDGFDTLYGFGGNDVLIGGNGGDALCGGLGRDILTGGSDADFFQFVTVADSGNGASKRDVITDFESGIDRIDLRAIDADTKTRGIDDAFTFVDEFTGTAGQLRAYAFAGGQIIEGDVNGDGKADFSIEIVANPFTHTLTAADFLL